MLAEATSPSPTMADLFAEGRRALTAGEAQAAVRAFSAMRDREPSAHDLWYWLSAAYAAAGLPNRAYETLDGARTRHIASVLGDIGVDMQALRGDPAQARKVGDILYDADMPGLASMPLRLLADTKGPAQIQIAARLALSLQHVGRVEEAATLFERLLNQSGSPAIHGFLLYSLFFVEDGFRRHAAEARRWAERHASGKPSDLSHAVERRADRRLRVGYIGPNFTQTQSRQFILPTLDNHDPDAVELFLYPRDDEAPPVKGATVRPLGRLDDAEAERVIRADHIDVLVDIWGHTAGGRMTLLARKPAPVQVSWINYLQTTGLPAIDYVLHADSMLMPEFADQFAETVWPIGEVSAPFRPDPTARTSPTPMLQGAPPTFGCFNHPAKLSDQTVRAWARILKAVPNSRLILRYRYFADATLQSATAARFAVFGANPDQIEFHGHAKGDAYEAAFAEIDLALDPSPCPGGTTTLEAISRGVPVLTLRGADPYARISLQPGLAMGLPELIADSWDDYVERATALTSAPQDLDALRSRVRPAFDASAFRDEAGFTRRLEDAYRTMFARWVEAP